ncbi:hypothetical protein HZR84_05935 [Hyphobacterium sp. CCMP332]|nr:hypothetical protein HZR84_05935 [Hyphobacterium sp. CCMP332]
MLEYSKTILKKVSFDNALFERELLKAIRNIITEKLEEFRRWCFIHFGQSHRDILIRAFNTVS